MTIVKQQPKNRAPRHVGLRRFVWILAGLPLFASIFAAATLGIIVLYPIDVMPYLRSEPSGEMLDRQGILLYAFLNSEEQWCFPRDLEGFSTRLLEATMAAEDQRFFRHPGVDVLALMRAAGQNVLGRRVVSGASTITMQVVKLGGRNTQSLSRKAAQMVAALRLERRAAKEDILCAYLNKAPYGLNLVGAEAAARRYFGKRAAELTLPEAALLAGLPKSPTAFQPLAHPERARARRAYVLRRMGDEGFIGPAEAEAAQACPLGAAWHAFPRQAPHLAMRLRNRISAEDAVRVALDAALQAEVETQVRAHLKRFDNDVTNAAVMVADVASGQVLARAGSADFFDAWSGGQVDICRAARSPGSALKPFTYALAIEQNRLYPSEHLFDGTLDYGKYNPGNFDGEYTGLISAADALHYSLNVPAITALERLGADAMQGFLQRIGLTTLTKAPEYYGLGLTIGSCEVRLDEMMAAYCMLANTGVYRPLREVLDDGPATGERLVSRGTALALYQMLEYPFPKELDARLVRAQGVHPRVCWKTGTSTGFHDAWAFAFNRQYVVGVWLGNSDGRASRRLVGAKAALPLAARIFRGLRPGSSPAWPETGGELRPVKVCAVSGLPASPWCPVTKTASLPRNQFLHRRCDMHHPHPDGEHIVERWPGMAHHWNLARIENPVTVTHARALQNRDSPCSGTREDSPCFVEEKVALRITNPVHRAQYVLTGEAQGDRIRLDATVEGRVPLFWYLDDRCLGVSRALAPLLVNLEPGSHKLACMAPGGETDVVQFEVISPDADAEFRRS